MTKKIFNQPMLQVVRIDKNICTDVIQASGNYNGSSTIEAPDRFRDSWDAGY